MRNILLVISFILLVIGLSYAEISPDYAPGTIMTEPVESPVSDVGWVTKAPFPTTRAHCMVSPVFTVGGVKKYYVFGGPTVSGGAYTNDNYEYNTETNTWTLKAPMPTARGIGRACLVGGKIYVIGGCVSFGTGLTTVEIYDPETNTWTTGPSMPVGNHDFGAGVYKDTFIYVCGGGNWSTSSPPTNAVYVLNTVTGVWSSATPMPTAMGTPCCGIIGNKIVMATGYVSGAGSNIVQIGTINPDNPTQITWTTGATMPGSAVYRANCGVAQGYLYVCGGNLTSGVSNAAYKYDPATNTWTQLPNKPTAVSNVYGWAADPAGKLYFPVGYNGSTYLTVHEMLDDVLLANDVGVMAIVSPGSSHLPNTQMTPQGRFKNFGTAAQTNFAVVCSIVNQTGTTRYTDTKIISLAPNQDTVVSFNSWTPTVLEQLTVIMRTMLAGDENPDNDRITSTCIVGYIAYVEIGNATTNSYSGPMNRFYNYSAHEVIYLQSEINTVGQITHIAYYKDHGTNLDPIDSVKIYMKHTPDQTLTSGAWSTTGYTLVYEGQYPNDIQSGWLEVQLNPPFQYNNTDNLGILILKGYQPYISTTVCPYWRYTTTSPTYRTRQSQSDASMPTTLTQTYNRPNIRLTFNLQQATDENSNHSKVVTILNPVKPNPVINGLAKISFTLAEPGNVNLSIYDASGRLIKTLVNSNLNTGTYSHIWNGKDESNRKVSEGIYFYTLKTDNYSSTRKLIFVH